MNTTYLLITLLVILSAIFCWYKAEKTYNDGIMIIAILLAVISCLMSIFSFVFPVGNPSVKFIPVQELVIESTPNRVVITVNNVEFTDKTAAAVNLVKSGNLKGVNYTQLVNAWNMEMSKPSIELVGKE